MNAGQGIYSTAHELAAALKEGLRMLTLIGSDPVLRIGLMEFLDGYTESVAHLSRMNTAGQVIFIGIEVALALATAGGTLAVGAARLACL